MIKCVNCQKPFQRGELMQVRVRGESEWRGGNHPMTDFGIQNVGRYENWPRRHVDCNAKPIEIDFFEAYRGAVIKANIPRLGRITIPIEEFYQAFKTRMQKDQDAVKATAKAHELEMKKLLDRHNPDPISILGETYNPTKVANSYGEVAEHITDRELTREQSAANLKAHNDILRNLQKGLTACGQARVEPRRSICFDMDCTICYEH